MNDARKNFRAAWRVLVEAMLAAGFCAGQVPVYTATTVAGNGGPSSTANISGAAGLIVDSAGDLYISDSQAVFKLTSHGNLSLVAGGGPGTPFLGDGGPATGAELLGPGGLALDNAGNLYIADTLDNRIRKVSSSGTISTIAEALPPVRWATVARPRASQPHGLALDSSGNLLFADTGHNRVRINCSRWDHYDGCGERSELRLRMHSSSLW